MSVSGRPSRNVPLWLARMVGLPGAVSFHRWRAVVREATAQAPEIASLSSTALRTEFTTVRMPTGGPLPRQNTARFLALVREGAHRTIGLRAFDEQLVACCALLSGHAVEMDTGEGKSLVGALAAAGHVLAGRRVHVLSVNDYLAERDARLMAPFFELIGARVAWVGQATDHNDRRSAYAAEVVYAPVSEVGFDVLRDRFAVAALERVAPHCDVAIVDEADAVMIDEAMVPLVLAGVSDHETDDLTAATLLVEDLVDGRDFTVDAERATVTLTDAGLDATEASLGGINLYAADNIPMLTQINLALHARVLVRRDVDYLIDNDAVKLINAGRGRVAHLQRWPDGLHAAVEAKERLATSAPGVILDSITIQDLLLQYTTLSGMSGTVASVAEDLMEFYRLPVGRVERHRANIRVDEPDRILIDTGEKMSAIVDEIVTRHATGQPVLVGTHDVAESELLAERLTAAGTRPRVLNARNDAEEAEIIARAGERGAVTISTQMSGRGTDIRLGGVDERDHDRVAAVGGLAVIATGRYPSGRLDSQLRGRAGRQGDPGTTIAFVSLDESLVQSNAPAHMLTEIGRQGRALPLPRRRQIVTSSQSIAEASRLARHRATWEYNRAIAAQRHAVIAHRQEIETGDRATAMLRTHAPDHLQLLERAGTDALNSTLRAIVVYYLDDHWMEHLALLHEIRDGIHLRALAGQKPADEFHRIALKEFHGFFDEVYRAASAFVETLTPDDVGGDLDQLGLRRPSATWTYMMNDNPFGSPGDRLARRLGRMWRSRILGIEE